MRYRNADTPLSEQPAQWTSEPESESLASVLQPLAPRFHAFFCCGIWGSPKLTAFAAALGQPKTMKRLVLATVLHVASTNNCERATDLKPKHFCAKPTNPDALRSAIPDDADALPLRGSAPPSLNVIQGSVAKQKARLLRKANTEGAPLVWVLDNYVGIGNALDAYVRAVIEARHRRRSLIIKSPILRNLCRIVGVRCINQIVAARLRH